MLMDKIVKKHGDIVHGDRDNSKPTVPEAEISMQCIDMEQSETKAANCATPIFTSGKIFEEALTELGVFPGIRLVVHSSLSSFGIFEGGAENLCRILCKLVTEDGTLRKNIRGSFTERKSNCADGDGAAGIAAGSAGKKSSDTCANIICCRI